jgi:hypothetical protein
MKKKKSDGVQPEAMKSNIASSEITLQGFDFGRQGMTSGLQVTSR